MTTYTPPHFANGLSDRNVRPSEKESNTRRARTVTPVYPAAAVNDEGAILADAYTPDWQPQKAKGMPKAAIGVFGAAVIGGIAVAALMLAPADKVTKNVVPDPIAAAAAQNTSSASTLANADQQTAAADAAVSQIDRQAPAAGPAANADNAAMQAAVHPTPAPVVQAPAISTPAARVSHRAVAPATAAPATTAPATDSAPAVNAVPAPVVAPDAVTTPSPTPASPDTPPAAMQQTPAAPTVVPAPPAPTADPTPAPATPDSGSTPAGNP
jgi:hypothetical protein